MQEFNFNVEYEGQFLHCSFTTSTSEVSCRVDYFVKIEKEPPAALHFAIEGDLELLENYASAAIEPGLKEVVRKALNEMVSKKAVKANTCS